MAKVVSKDDMLHYKWLGREEGFTALEHEIVFREICSGCGACAAVCPDKVIAVDEYPKLVSKCTNCGYCLMECPRAYMSDDEIEEKMFGSVAEDIVGRYSAALAAKAKDSAITAKAQDGGFVSAMLAYALEKKIIDGVIVTGSSADKPWKPVPKIATTKEEVIQSMGSKYSNSPTVSLLKEAKEKGFKNIALVGMPCQIQGFSKVKHYPLEELAGLTDIVKLTVAIFCKGNFMYDVLCELIENKYKIPMKSATKFDIKGKSFTVFQGAKKVDIPLDEALKFKRDGCKVCIDFTGRISDFSIGSVGSGEGWSTVLARTGIAAEILNGMKKSGAVETRELDAEKGLPSVRKLCELKEKDAKKVIRKKIKEALPMPLRYMKF